VKFDCQLEQAEKESAEKGNRDYSSSRKERRLEKRRNYSRSIWKSPSKVQSCNSVLWSVSSFDAVTRCSLFLLLVVLILYIHEIVASDSFKRIRISCADVSRITFPSVSVSANLVYIYIYIYIYMYIYQKKNAKRCFFLMLTIPGASSKEFNAMKRDTTILRLIQN